MQEFRKLLLAGAAMLLLGIIVLFPARVAYHWFAPDELRMAGIEGTVWNGAAADTQIAGVYLRDLRWTLQPLRLLAGRFAYTVTAEPASGFIEADVAVSLLGTAYIDTLSAAVPLSVLDGALRMDDVAGDLSLQFESIKIEDGWPVNLEGRAAVANLLVRALAAAPLGDFQAEFQTTDGSIIGSVSDLRGMLQVAGTITLDPDRSYALVGRVGATASAAESVNQQLRFLGSPDSRGLREFRIEGAL